jgi:hypothetical protein
VTELLNVIYELLEKPGTVSLKSQVVVIAVNQFRVKKLPHPARVTQAASVGVIVGARSLL